MIIIIDSNYFAQPKSKLLGNKGETMSRQLEVTFPTVDKAQMYKLRFVLPDGITCYELDITSGSADVSGSLLAQEGSLLCQWIAVGINENDNYNVVAKSNVFTLYVGESLEAEGAQPVPTYEETAELFERAVQTLSQVEHIVPQFDGIVLQLGEHETELEELNNELGNSANSIVTTASGDTVDIADSSSAQIKGLTLCGKTTQNGIPTPQAPIELVNAGNSRTIKVTVSDGKEQSQSVSVGIPSNLCGIPVASGGNYTDENGQAWICDELDLENGVYIKRTEKKRFTLTKQVYATSPLGYRYTAFATLGSDFCLCEQLPYNANAATHLATTDGIRCAAQYGTIAAQYTDTAGDTQTLAVDVLYVLTNPIEAPLTSEQTEAIKALYTYYPSTIVTNNGGAGMKIKYTADTKLYVDNKFAELSAAILGGN